MRKAAVILAIFLPLGSRSAHAGPGAVLSSYAFFRQTPAGQAATGTAMVLVQLTNFSFEG